MAYGHAERVLAAIGALEAEAAELLCRLPQLDAERASWLDEVVAAAMRAPGRLAGYDGAQVRPPTAHGPASLRVAPVIAPAMQRCRGSGMVLIVAGPVRGRCCPATALLSASVME